MTKTEMFCHKYSRLRNCAGYRSGGCSTCYCYDVVEIGYCDRYGAELDDEDCRTDGSLELCPDCRAKLKGENHESIEF